MTARFYKNITVMKIQMVGLFQVYQGLKTLRLQRGCSFKNKDIRWLMALKCLKCFKNKPRELGPQWFDIVLKN